MSSLYGGGGKYINPTGTPQSVAGTGYKQLQSPQFTKDQLNLFKSLFSQTSPDSFLGRLSSGDESQFADMEAPAQRQFSELLGGLGSRFSGMGGLGARKSSGFQNTATSAASNFSQELQSNRMNIQRQALQDLLGLSNQLLGQRPYDQAFIPKQQKEPGFWKSILSGLAGTATQTLGDFGTIYAGSKFGQLGNNQPNQTNQPIR